MMAKKRAIGIVLAGPDQDIQKRAAGKSFDVVVDPKMPLAFYKTLFVEPGTQIPWDLLPAAWHFLERWDAAVPLWRYGITAEEVGSSQDRKHTQAIIRDLRVLLHAVELLFIRGSELGKELHQIYVDQLAGGGDKRLRPFF